MICRGVDRWINEPGRAVDLAGRGEDAHHVLLTGLVRETLVEWERSKRAKPRDEGPAGARSH